MCTLQLHATVQVSVVSMTSLFKFFLCPDIFHLLFYPPHVFQLLVEKGKKVFLQSGPPFFSLRKILAQSLHKMLIYMGQENPSSLAF